MQLCIQKQFFSARFQIKSDAYVKVGQIGQVDDIVVLQVDRLMLANTINYSYSKLKEYVAIKWIVIIYSNCITTILYTCICDSFFINF